MYKLLTVYYFAKTRWFQGFHDRKKLENYQQKLLDKQYSFIKKHSPFYQNNDIPVMDKQVMMENFDKINTVGITKDEAFSFAINNEKSRQFNSKFNNVTVGLSTGTSGNRGLFLVSNKEKAMWAGSILAKMLPKNHLLFHKIAFFMRADSPLYQSVKSPVLKFEFFDLILDMEENLNKLNNFAPTILIAPPSMLYLIAKAQESGKINIKPVRTISIAEVLEEKDAEFIKKSLKLDCVHQVYQCTEGLLACTCHAGHLHLNEDIVKIDKEMIDDTRFFPIITDLKRQTQPVISYKLNDILCLSKKTCECGSSFTVIDKIEGRSDDIFQFKSQFSDEKIYIFPDFIRNIMSFASSDFNYRVVQESLDLVHIFLDCDENSVKFAIENEFLKFSETKNAKCPKLEFFPYQYDIKKKLKRVECKL